MGESKRVEGMPPIDPSLTVQLPNSASDSLQPTLELSGDLADRFRIIALLGRGGMGEVYSAEDLTLGRRVALKAIRPDRGFTPLDRERFQHEARLLSRLEHPGICRIHDLIESEGRDFLVLELIAGSSLRQIGDRLSHRDRLDVAGQIAAVLEAAHAEGIIHRDLKPDNIMITPDGQAKVLDFGLARDLAGQSTDDADGALMGTPAYLSPEQARGEAASTASDVYGFGLVLQRIFTGQRPYEESEDVREIVEQAREAHTRPVHGIDRDLARLIGGLTTRKPELRPTAREARHRIVWIQQKPARRIRRWAIAAAVALVLVGTGKYLVDLRHERSIAQRHRAEAEGLVEFMLGDLRERLEPVGRLDVLDEVGNRALEYFAAQSEDERTDADRHRFARAMNQIGEVRLNQGDLEAAREAFLNARDAASALTKSDPRQGEWLLTEGASEFWLGNVAYLEGNLDGAEKSFRAYLVIAKRLVALDSKNADWQREVGYAHMNLAALYEARGQFSEALVSLDESIRIKRWLGEATPDDPGQHSDLINSLAWQANIQLVVGDLETAHDRFAESVEETEKLIRLDPKNMEHISLLSVLLHSQAVAAEWLGRQDGVDELYTASLGYSLRLATHDPSNAVWQNALADTRLALGRRALSAGDPATAAQQYNDVLNLFDDSTDLDSAEAERLSSVAAAHRGLARVEMEAGSLSAAGEQIRLALDSARRVLAAEDPGRAAHHAAARCFLLASEIEIRGGHPEIAREFQREVFDLLRPLANQNRDCVTRDLWVRALAHQGDLEGAARVAAELRSDGYAREDFEEFCSDFELLTLATNRAE